MAGTLKLGQLLVAQGLIHPDELAVALAAQQDQGGGRLGRALIAMGAVEEEQLIQVLAEQLGVQVARIGERTVCAEIIELIPPEVAEKHRCLPLFLRDEDAGEVLVLGMEDPSDAAAVDDVQRHVRCGLRPVLIAPTELEAALERYYRSAEPGAPEDPLAAPGMLPALSARAEGEETPGPLLPPMNLLDTSDDASWSEPADDPGLTDDTFAGEDPFAAFDKEPFAADAESVAREEPTDPVCTAAETRVPAAAERQEAILQALAQLLVEKGVITREEFATRLRQLMRQSD
ncbi:MAG: hypothetical protein JRH16_07690 [Deltaproteobacteria bacterium]|nr:hypothetical protein [Deltaproteobacteria bacterium]MBW2361871.1 hypothetical protein [Deltaproteobacteria bacterium]